MLFRHLFPFRILPILVGWDRRLRGLHLQRTLVFHVHLFRPRPGVPRFLSRLVRTFNLSSHQVIIIPYQNDHRSVNGHAMRKSLPAKNRDERPVKGPKKRDPPISVHFTPSIFYNVKQVAPVRCLYKLISRFSRMFCL